MRDPETGASKGYGFINYDTFEASDASIASMNGQYLCGRPISVSYALKKDSKIDRHGSAAERLLAANNPAILGTKNARPHMIFAGTPPMPPRGGGAPPGMMFPPPPPGMGMGFAPPPPPPGYGMPGQMM